VRAAIALFLLLAGCLGESGSDGTRETRAEDNEADAGLDMSFFESCPVVNGTEIDCQRTPENPFFVEVSPDWPTHWSCLSFADRRFAENGVDYPYPDWYTLFGPAVSDGAGGVEPQMGFAYDTHNDTDRVAGVIRLVSEGREEMFSFEGPARGFVRVPVRIAEPQLFYTGVLYPAAVGHLAGEYAFPPGAAPENVTAPANFLNATGLDVGRSEPHWSLVDYRGPAAPADVKWQFDVVRTVPSEGTAYHFPATPEFASGISDYRELSGAANWGMGRGYPYETQVRHGDVAVEGQLQPYMFFGAKFEDVYNPVYVAGVHYQCGCYGQPLTTVEGVVCLAGGPPIAGAATWAVQLEQDGRWVRATSA
jgi:hypothetical protein